MSFPINLRSGWIQVTISPQKRFDNPGAFHEIIDPEELLSCWHNLKHIVDGIVDEQIGRSKSVLEANAKSWSIIDIYNKLHNKMKVDEDVLLKEVLKTGNFTDDEAKFLIKKAIHDKKIQDGMAWY